MTTVAIEVGTEVVRLTGEDYQIGNKGTVVEVSGERLRVFWHTNKHQSIKPKRTWVKQSVVRVAV